MKNSALLAAMACSLVSGCAAFPEPSSTKSMIAKDAVPLVLDFAHKSGASGYSVLIQPTKGGGYGNLNITVKNTGALPLSVFIGRIPLGSGADRSADLRPGESQTIFNESAVEFFNHWRELIISSAHKGILSIEVQLTVTGISSDLPLTIKEAANPMGVY